MSLDTQGNHARIGFAVNHSNSYPAVVESEIREDYYSLFTPVRRGNLRVVMDGKLLFDGDLQPGMLRLVAPGQRTTVALRSKIRHINLTIPGPELRRTLSQAGYRSTSYLQPLLRPDATVARIASALMETPHLQGKERQLYIDGLTHSLLACLLLAQEKPGLQQRRDRPLSDPEFRRCCEYAEAMLKGKLNLAVWAATVEMEPTQFTRRFRERTHQAPYAWFLNRKMEQAQRLLEQQTVSIADIALGLGFCSQSHFTEAFRRRMGCSPARWRAARLGRDVDKPRNLKDALPIAL